MIKRIKNKAKTRYDLPLYRGTGGHMLVWLIGLMSYLAVLSVVMILGLNTMTQHWTQGVQDHMTVELPFDENNKNTLETIQDITDLLNDTVGVSAEIIPEYKVLEMVEPWFGSLNADQSDMLPIPSLIDVSLDSKQPINLDELTKKIQDIDDQAILNTHEDWLDDVLSFSKAVRFIVFGIAAIMLSTALIAVSNAARTRLTLHHDEVDLLHLIGASDTYIARQFQRQTMRLAFEGSIAGLVLGLLTLWAASSIGPKIQETLMPSFKIQITDGLVFICIPVVIVLLTMLVSRFTVVSALKKLP